MNWRFWKGRRVYDPRDDDLGLDHIEGVTRTIHWGGPSTASRAANILGVAADTLRDRDAEYKGSDALYAATMAALFPGGIDLATTRDHHRFHLFMLMMIKVTRYVRNWSDGHADSLIDLAAYAAMLAALDQEAGPAPGD